MRRTEQLLCHEDTGADHGTRTRDAVLARDYTTRNRTASYGGSAHLVGTRRAAWNKLLLRIATRSDAGEDPSTTTVVVVDQGKGEHGFGIAMGC